MFSFSYSSHTLLFSNAVGSTLLDLTHTSSVHNAVPPAAIWKKLSGVFLYKKRKLTLFLVEEHDELDASQSSREKSTTT